MAQISLNNTDPNTHVIITDQSTQHIETTFSSNEDVSISVQHTKPEEQSLNGIDQQTTIVQLVHEIPTPVITVINTEHTLTYVSGQTIFIPEVIKQTSINSKISPTFNWTLSIQNINASQLGELFIQVAPLIKNVAPNGTFSIETQTAKSVIVNEEASQSLYEQLLTKIDLGQIII